MGTPTAGPCIQLNQPLDQLEKLAELSACFKQLSEYPSTCNTSHHTHTPQHMYVYISSSLRIGSERMRYTVFFVKPISCNELQCQAGKAGKFVSAQYSQLHAFHNQAKTLCNNSIGFHLYTYITNCVYTVMHSEMVPTDDSTAVTQCPICYRGQPIGP